ncbi:ROK family protein [Zongyangia hominis]|uniref:ROK family protein n=1 Tax=Zongyangia hominis TaxID=2763677 RepID=A0A926EBS0_9FIRM|nr:ROK family protein [Zongyangia hominis]MBC8569449.1 ROK family protein [Zongyangia hominis]
MQSQPGKPELIKKMNMELIYHTLLSLGSATRGEIASHTRMSVTTVRTLLEELVELGEIVESALDESSGGRRPQRYALSPHRNRMLLCYLDREQLHYRIASLMGETLEEGEKALSPSRTEEEALDFALWCREERQVTAVGLGVPGIVEEGGFLVSDCDHWVINDIGERMRAALGLPVLLENDLNAIALGFCRRYSQSHPGCSPEQVNMAYIHFNVSCTGAGVIADGKVVRGDKNFAGELGFLPMGGGKTLDAAIAGAAGDGERAGHIAQAVAAVNCVANPALIVIGGDLFHRYDVDFSQILQKTKELIPARMLPDIVYSDACREDYLSGLSYLTSRMLLPLLPFRPAAGPSSSAPRGGKGNDLEIR